MNTRRYVLQAGLTFVMAFALSVALFVAMQLVASAAALVQAAGEPTTLQLWTAVLAILTTIISAVLLSFPEHWGPWAKRVAVAIIAAILSSAGLWYEGRLDMGDLGRTWLLVFIGATALYTLLLRPATDALKGNPQT